MPRPRLYEQVAEQITGWMAEKDLRAGDKLPPERDLAKRLGVSRTTVSQALVALEVIGVVNVRHGDGAIVSQRSAAIHVIDAIREHALRLPEIIDARDALETKIASLAADRHDREDLQRIEAALDLMAKDIATGGRGVEGDELFHAAVTAASHSSLLVKMMAEISELIRESRIESLSQPGRPKHSLKAHRRIADAIASRDAAKAAWAMHSHLLTVSKIAQQTDNIR